MFYEIKKEGEMRVPARIIGNEKIIKSIEKEAIEQLKNVATLRGIEKYALGMPDMHYGYGFPIGGVAGIDTEEGVISPGGIGFDINCGVRLIKTDVKKEEIKIKEVVDELFKKIPSGVGSKGKNFNKDEFVEICQRGAEYICELYGSLKDLKNIEEKGKIKNANFENISQRAFERGKNQLGTLGSGNHFLEIQYVEEIFEEEIAKEFGLFKDQIVVMIHTGSRGFGHQVASDYIKLFLSSYKKYGIKLVDKQLVNVPFNSKEGEKYFSAMACAANYAFANRQLIKEKVKEVLDKFGVTSSLLYDIAHNIAKIEKHDVNGVKKDLIVHRKGATRAFPKGIVEGFEKFGHPALLPGSMGTASYILVGKENIMNETFGTVAHGSGRVMSRKKAKKEISYQELRRRLEKKGIYVLGESKSTIVEEAPEAYKDVEEVVNSLSFIAKKVAKMKPLGVIKG